jgi:GNAT superfamily N-acetyltransferase
VTEHVNATADTSRHALALRAEANLCAAIRVWASAAEGGDVLDDRGVVGLRVNAPLRAFNQAVLTEPGTAAKDYALAARWLSGRPRIRIRLREELAEGLGNAVTAAGMEPRGGIPSLALAALSTVHALEVEDTVIRRVDESNLRDHVAIVTEAFDWEDDVLATVFTPRLVHDASWRAYVAYAGREPVATAQLVVSGGVGGLYYVGTREAWRGKGLGEAVTRHAVGDAASLGCDAATLQASPFGYPVYRRIGFEDVAYYRTYVSPDPH